MSSSSSRSNSLENRLIRNIIGEFPQMTEIIKRHFGDSCLKRPSFKIKTLGMACILFGVDQKRLLQEFEKVKQ